MNRAPLVWAARLLLGIGISVASLWLAFRDVPLSELLAFAERANYWWLLPALAFQLASVLARAKRWRVLLQNRASLIELFWAQTVGFIGTNLLPLRAGEPARILVASQRSGVPFFEVSATAVLERVFDVLTILALFVVLLAFVSLPAAVAGGATVLAIVIGCVMAAIAYLLAMGSARRRVVGLAIRPLPEAAQQRVVRVMEDLVAGLEAIRRPNVAVAAAGWSGVTWIFAVLTNWAVIQSVNSAGQLVDAALMVAVISIGISIPSSPGFIGVFQLLGQQALAVPFPDRYTASSALSIALLAHLTYFIPTTILGAFGLLRAGTSLSRLHKLGPSRG